MQIVRLIDSYAATKVKVHLGLLSPERCYGLRGIYGRFDSKIRLEDIRDSIRTQKNDSQLPYPNFGTGFKESQCRSVLGPKCPVPNKPCEDDRCWAALIIEWYRPTFFRRAITTNPNRQ